MRSIYFHKKYSLVNSLYCTRKLIEMYTLYNKIDSQLAIPRMTHCLTSFNVYHTNNV